MDVIVSKYVIKTLERPFRAALFRKNAEIVTLYEFFMDYIINKESVVGLYDKTDGRMVKRDELIMIKEDDFYSSLNEYRKTLKKENYENC